MTLEQALQYLETTARVSCPQITCEQAREIAELIRRENAYWNNEVSVSSNAINQLSAAEKERDEALAKLREVERGRDEVIAELKAMAGVDEEWERDNQTACGFAWDCGREMAALETLNLLMREYIAGNRDLAIAVGEDFDADDYAKPGKR